MKHVVTEQYLEEAQVHPPEVSKFFGEVVTESLEQLLNEIESFEKVQSPYSRKGESEAFSKGGYQYSLCKGTGSLVLNPRPSAEMVCWYFQRSPRARYRQSQSYLDATSALRAHQTQIHAGWIGRLLRSDDRIPQTVAEFESETSDLLIALKAQGFDFVHGINPRCSEALFKRHEIRIATSSDQFSSMEGKMGVVAAFRVFEQQFDPKTFIQDVHRLLSKGGHLVLTTRVASGFDIQALWENAAISPMEHMNLPTLEGLKALIEQAGFSIQELSTPGQLDVQLLERAIADNPELKLPRWIDYFIQNRDEYAKVKLQTFLQENLLSSNLRLVARKK